MHKFERPTFTQRMCRVQEGRPALGEHWRSQPHVRVQASVWQSHTVFVSRNALILRELLQVIGNNYSCSAQTCTATVLMLCLTDEEIEYAIYLLMQLQRRPGSLRAATLRSSTVMHPGGSVELDLNDLSQRQQPHQADNGTGGGGGAGRRPHG